MYREYAIKYSCLKELDRFENNFSHIVVFTHVRYFYLTDKPVPACGKDKKKRTVARWVHVDP